MLLTNKKFSYLELKLKAYAENSSSFSNVHCNFYEKKINLSHLPLMKDFAISSGFFPSKLPHVFFFNNSTPYHQSVQIPLAPAYEFCIPSCNLKEKNITEGSKVGLLFGWCSQALNGYWLLFDRAHRSNLGEPCLDT